MQPLIVTTPTKQHECLPPASLHRGDTLQKAASQCKLEMLTCQSELKNADKPLV